MMESLTRYAFPALKLCALFCLHSGALLRYAIGNKHNHEQTLTRTLIEALEKGDVLLADCGFCSYAFIAILLGRGVDSVMRLHQSRPRDFRQGKRLGPDERLVSWPQPPPRKNDPWAAEHRSLPRSLPIRIVRWRVEIPGFRTREVCLATTLLDAGKYPLEALAELYLQRWGVELRFRERVARQRPSRQRGAHSAPPPGRQIKISLGADVLRCKSPAMVEKELCLNAIAYNLTRCVMQESAHRHDVDLGRVSSKGTLDTMRHYADPIHAARPKAREKLYDAMLEIIARDLV